MVYESLGSEAGISKRNGGAGASELHGFSAALNKPKTLFPQRPGPGRLTMASQASGLTYRMRERAAPSPAPGSEFPGSHPLPIRKPSLLVPKAFGISRPCLNPALPPVPSALCPVTFLLRAFASLPSIDRTSHRIRSGRAAEAEVAFNAAGVDGDDQVIGIAR